MGDLGMKMGANPDEIKSLSDAFSIVNVPMSRRLQTAAVASFVCVLPATILCWLFGIALLLNPVTLVPMLAYFIFIFFVDKAPTTGARTSQWVRRAAWWKHFAAYFPMSLRSEQALDPDKKYVFGYHPHGIISVGALACFGTEGLGFSDTFKGIDVHLVTLPTNFKCPFLREIWILLGICDSSKETFKCVLSSKSGSAIAVVVGGAAESLESCPGQIELVLAQRKGFVRQALMYGACLVPTVGNKFSKVL
jgi:2-acylglycerol O-acyltransferase 2